MSSLLRLTRTAEIARAHTAGGKRDRTTATVVESGVPCTSLYPSGSNYQGAGALALDPASKTIMDTFDVYMPGDTDVQAGDWITIAGVLYLAKQVQIWPGGLTKVVAEYIRQ